MFEAYSARARLTASERRVFDDKRLEGAFSASDLLEQLNTQIGVARAAQITSKSLKQTLIICFLFAALAFVPAVVLDPVWLAAPAGLVVIGFMLVLARRRLRSYAVPPHVPATAFPFLTVLKHDLAPNEPVRVRVDLREPTAAAKRTKVSAPYKLKSYYKVVDTTYVDPWFEGEARLADGSELRWSVTDELRVSARRKRNPRGKIKSKTRHYKTSQIEVSVAFPAKLYRLQEVPDVTGQKVSMKQNEKRCTLTVKRTVKGKSLEPLPPRQLLDAIAVAFGAAKPARGAA